jgi:hypothetical protein
MKTQQIMNPKERNVVSLKRVIKLVFIILFSSSILKAQGFEDSRELSDGQYEFLNIAFGGNSDQDSKVFYQPQISKSWINEFLNLKSENGIGTCLFDEPFLMEAIDQLQDKEFSLKTFDKKKFPKRIIPLKNSQKKKGLHISEPIILKTYSFILVWDSGYKAVEIYHKEPGEMWKFKCFAILCGKL